MYPGLTLEEIKSNLFSRNPNEELTALRGSGQLDGSTKTIDEGFNDRQSQAMGAFTRGGLSAQLAEFLVHLRAIGIRKSRTVIFYTEVDATTAPFRINLKG